jgi:hypothetical protein
VDDEFLWDSFIAEELLGCTLKVQGLLLENFVALDVLQPHACELFVLREKAARTLSWDSIRNYVQKLCTAVFNF